MYLISPETLKRLRLNKGIQMWSVTSVQRRTS